MLDLFNGEGFEIRNKFLNELNTAVQAAALLLTTSSPMADKNASLYDLLGYNDIEEVRPEVAIRVNTVHKLITAEYSIISSITLLDVEQDTESPDGLLVTILVIDSRNVPYELELEII